ncbi:MAG: hypothetical protein V7K64_31905 [Nostoc sp.]|uniref:hypothetical protein n=1 Tax=unclassified Nostoc TaxID=2593658 RepID=UPI001DEA92F1|nr:hypothetical protein [Nostoc sp. JL34]MBN3885087.1 hypothetical protein [Nostoc sp. JL34]
MERLRQRLRIQPFPETATPVYDKSSVRQVVISALGGRSSTLEPVYPPYKA